nr:hypothetical protein CFP56_21901 [Quercus suber]
MSIQRNTERRHQRQEPRSDLSSPALHALFRPVCVADYSAPAPDPQIDAIHFDTKPILGVVFRLRMSPPPPDQVAPISIRRTRITKYCSIVHTVQYELSPGKS